MEKASGDPQNKSGEMTINDGTLKYISVLKDANIALAMGLETALDVIEKWDEYPPEKRETIIKSLRTLIETSKELHGEKPTAH